MLPIVAPAVENSAMGHAISIFKPLHFSPVHRDGQVFGWGLAGTPADDVLVVLRDVTPYADLLREVFDEHGVPLDLEGDDPLVRKLSRAMMEEAARVGLAMGMRANPPVETMLERIRSLGAFKMSMLQDVEHGKPVEIDALLTVIHDIGAMVGVPTPFIDSVLGLARLRAAGRGLLHSVA